MSQILYINNIILVDWSLSGIMTSKLVNRESESPRSAASSILISRMTSSSVIIPYGYHSSYHILNTQTLSGTLLYLSHQYLFDNIGKLQIEVARIITGTNRYPSKELLYRETGWLPLSIRRSIHRLNRHKIVDENLFTILRTESNNYPK